MTFIILLFSLLPGFAWLLFYLKEDIHPEPKKLIALVFSVGMASAFLAFPLEKLASADLNALGVHTSSPLSLFLMALIEELLKFGAAYLVMRKNPALDEPIDAMIYATVAALGFATLENIGAVVGNGAGQTASLLTLGGALAMTSLRFVGATLLHSLTSAIVGFHWALGMIKNKLVWSIITGLAAAALLHSLFNYIILRYGNLAYTLVLLSIVGFFVLNDFEKLKQKTLQ